MNSLANLSADIVGTIIGASIITFPVYYGLRLALKTRIFIESTRIYLTLIISILILLIFSSQTLGLERGIVSYVPLILFWFAVDKWRSNRINCPNCQKRIKTTGEFCNFCGKPLE